MRKDLNKKIKYFFSESFRARTIEEYSAVFLRGLKANKLSLSDGAPKSRVPWLYLRVLAFGFILFAVVTAAYRLCNGSTDLISTVIYGALFFNVATLVFFYELYPENDLSLLLLLLIVLAGGAVTSAVISLGYEFIYDDPFMSSPWVSLIWTAFWEELVKGAAAVCAVILLKNKNPFYCFLIGFAVGTGYSYLEDLGYIYSYTVGGKYEWAVLMSVGRGLSCAFSHAPWTGLIAWAFVKFEKPYKNFRFYAVTAACMVLHYFADVPFFVEELQFLKGFNLGWLIETAVVASIVSLLFFALKKPVTAGGKAEILVRTNSSVVGNYSHIANVTALVCAVAASAVALIGCSLDIGYKYDYYEIYGDENFIALEQDGKTLKADWEREYDETSENYLQIIIDGGAVRTVQAEEDGDATYYYYYSADENGAKTLTNIAVKTYGSVYYCTTLEIYDGFYYVLSGYPWRVDYIPDDPAEIDDSDEPDEPAEPAEPSEPEDPPALIKTVYYYAVSPVSYSYDTERDCYRVRSEEQSFHGLAEAISLAALTVLISAGGVTAFVILKKKSGKVRYD